MIQNFKINESHGVIFFIVIIAAIQFFVFAIDPISKFVWIYTFLICMGLVFAYRRSVPILVMVFFFLPYMYIPKYFFFDSVFISFWMDYQDAYFVNFVSLLNSLFFVSLYFGTGKLSDSFLKNKKIVGSLRDANVFFATSFVLLIIIVFGVTGDTVFESGRYGTGEVSKSALHEFFIVFFIVSVFSLNLKSSFQKNVLAFLLIIYTFKTLIYGGRIEILQLWLGVLYLVFNFFEKRRAFLFFLSLLAYLIFDFISQIRSNPLLILSLYDLNFFWYLEGDFDRKFISNQFGDVYQSSLRVVGLVHDGYIDALTRVSSFLTIIFGVLLPSNLMPDFYNLSSYKKSIAMSGGGGLVSAFSFVWLSFFGPILFGFFVGFMLRKFYQLNNPLINIYGLLILITFPRWFAYYPVILFKMNIVGVLLVSLVLFLKKKN